MICCDGDYGWNILIVMFDQLRQLVYSDKIFEHKVLGKVSCAAFADTLKECKSANFRSGGLDPCLELKQLTN